MYIKHLSLKTTIAAVAMSLAFAGPALAGSVSGTIKFKGAAPAAKKLSVNKDVKVCGKNPIMDNSILVKGGGLANVVITIKGAKGGKFPKSMTKATVDQNGCVRMGMNIYKTGTYYFAGCIQFFFSFNLKRRLQLLDFTVFNRNISPKPRFTGTIDNGSVFDQQITHF